MTGKLFTLKPSHALCACMLLVSPPSPVHAAEYFVGPEGSDTNSGLHRTAAFATVQHGVDALAAGDTLTILPGEYLESVQRNALGTNDTVTTIRAAIPGTAILRGDVPVTGFRKVDGYRFVYVTECPAEPPVQAVIEQDTLAVLPGQPNVVQLEMAPGAFYHDVAAGKLYVSATGLSAVPEHAYSASVIATHGMYLFHAQRVVIEGLGVTGFHSTNLLHYSEGGMGSVWGIFLNNSRRCVVRDCRAWFNGSGIGLNSEDATSGDNVIERCTAWANVRHYSPEDLGGMSMFRARRDTIRACVAFANGTYGINIYGTGTDGGTYGEWDVPGNDEANRSRLIDNVAWGNRAADFKIKTGVRYFHTVERCIGPGLWSVTPSNVTHSLIGCSTRDFGRDNIVLSQETNLDLHAEFVDPDHHDYRLRANSRFRGTGPDGSDRGPYAYDPAAKPALAPEFLQPPLPSRLSGAESVKIPDDEMQQAISPTGRRSRSPVDDALAAALRVSAPAEVRIDGPYVHSLSDTTANLEWWVSAPGLYRVRWSGDTDRTNSIDIDSAAYGSFSLTDLRSGHTYSFGIGANEPLRNMANGKTVTVAVVTFSTAAAPLQPRTLYVATDGDDGNDGITRRHAWRTVQHAADRVRPGDTVLIAGGTYSESVRIKATGARELPIVFKALPGEKVIFDGMGRNLSFAFLASVKSHLRFDGFYFTDFALNTADAPWSQRTETLNGAINLYRGEDIAITRCFMDGRGTGYSPGLVMAMHTPDLTVRNSVIVGTMGGGVTIYWDSPGARVEHNVFLVSLISHTGIQVNKWAVDTPERIPCLDRNIFTDNLAKKAHAALLYNSEMTLARTNCFFLRVPANERAWSKDLPTVADFIEDAGPDGLDRGNLAADPHFAGDPGLEPDPRSWVGYSPDRMLDRSFPLDFDFLFATNPEVVKRGIGLQPEAFADFHFNRPDRPDRPVPADVARIDVSHHPAHTPRMTDGNEQTYWSTAANQERGMWIELHFAQARTIRSLAMDCGNGYPGAYGLYLLTADGWGDRPVSAGAGTNGLARIEFPQGTTGTGLKMVITEPRTNEWWIIRELRVNERRPVVF